MNKKLVFSWGHIIALLAVIAFSYLAFVGLCYYTGGRFTLAGLLVVGIDLLLIFSFIGAQQLKIWDGPFQRYIIVERFMLMLMAPLSVAVAMFPVNHWLSLHENEDYMANMFTESIDSAKVIFDDYESYANLRINQLGERIYQQHKVGFGGSKSQKKDTEKENSELKAERQLVRENTMRALRLMLLSQNYEDIRTSALKWMEETADAPNTLNVFLLGNIDEIAAAIEGWGRQLGDFSHGRLSDESKETVDYEPNLDGAVSQLLLVKSFFRSPQPLQTNTLWVALGLFVLMMVPWWVQSRNTKSLCRLFGSEGSTPIDLIITHGTTSKHQRRKKTLKDDEHDYLRHVRKF